MITIAILMLVACTGSIYGLFLLKREKEKSIARLINQMELEAGLTTNTTIDEGQNGPIWRLIHRLAPSTAIAAINERLLWAGKPYNLDAGQLISLKVVGAATLAMLVPLVTLFQLGSLTFMTMGLAALAGFVLPDVWLSNRLAERRRQVNEELPLFADLIATAVSAGLPLTEAVRRVAADAPGLVAREFLRAAQEMAAGKPRLQAWRDLIDRVPGDDLRTIVNAVMQAEQYGTSVADILHYQVQQIRMFKGQVA
jgi:tight adherence protein C